MPIDPDRFAAFLTLAGLSDATVRVYRPMCVRWCDYATAVHADPYQPDPLTVRAWSRTLPRTRSTLAHARATIGHLCRALQVPDVSDAIPLPRHPRPNPRGLDLDDAARLLDAADRAGVPGLAVKVAAYTGARRGEVASLAWRRIDLDAGRITLERSKVGDLHTVPLHPQLAAALAERRVPGEVWVFPGRYGGHVAPATVWTWVREVAAAAGLDGITPHRLRHTALTLANDRTGDLRAVQQLAGHTDPAVTARYTRASADALRRAVAALDYRPTG